MTLLKTWFIISFTLTILLSGVYSVEDLESSTDDSEESLESSGENTSANDTKKETISLAKEESEDADNTKNEQIRLSKGKRRQFGGPENLEGPLLSHVIEKPIFNHQVHYLPKPYPVLSVQYYHKPVPVPYPVPPSYHVRHVQMRHHSKCIYMTC